MSRRMIDPQTIIKSQIADDKFVVDLNEILEKYGVETEYTIKSVTLQFYSKANLDDSGNWIYSDSGNKGFLIANTAITISKDTVNDVYILGMIVDNLTNMNLQHFIQIDSGDYENGIILQDTYEFDVHVIKV